MNADERTLEELFREAAADQDKLELESGLRVGLSVGGILVAIDQDGRHKELSELPSHVVEALARELRESAEARLFDPADNELLKFSDL